MYTVLVNLDNTLTKSKVERIMQGASMVDKLHFLVDEEYKGHNMRNFSATLEYILPISRKYKIEPLTPSEELYKDKIEYVIPFDTSLTNEPGEVEIKLLFTYLDMDADGKPIEFVRPTDSAIINILPTAQWATYISDANLDSIAQMMLTNQAQIEQLKEYAEIIKQKKADNIELDAEKNLLYLTSDGEQIGDAVNLEQLGEEIADSTNAGLVKVII